MYEEWKKIEYDKRYQVSNLGRFRKTLKNGYRYLKPFKKHELYVVKIKDKELNAARLVANAFIKPLKENEQVYHKNHLSFDNFYRNLEVLSPQELGKRTGHISKSKRVVEVKNNEITREWRSSRVAAKKLFISRQTVSDYCNNKVKKPMFNLMWEDDYFDKVLEPFSWEYKTKGADKNERNNKRVHKKTKDRF